MNLNVSDDKTILVFANYRTGSTALCDWLSKKTGLVNYDEAFHPLGVTNSNYKNKKCIIKIMPDHTTPQDFNELVSQSCIIGIQRRNLIEQIASFYICDKTRRWHQHKNESTQDYLIEINNYDIENQISYILKMQQAYHQLPYRKDLEVYYEDIVDLLDNSKYTEYHKPVNYADLLTTVNILFYKVKERISNESN